MSKVDLFDPVLIALVRNTDPEQIARELCSIEDPFLEEMKKFIQAVVENKDCTVSIKKDRLKVKILEDPKVKKFIREFHQETRNKKKLS